MTTFLRQTETIFLDALRKSTRALRERMWAGSSLFRRRSRWCRLLRQLVVRRLMDDQFVFDHVPDVATVATIVGEARQQRPPDGA